MVRSMTGYGSVKKIIEGKEISFEIKSVNHRYFDFSCRIPRIYGFLEDKLKKLAQGHTTRGKVDVYLSINVIEDQSTNIMVNHGILRSYLETLRGIQQEYGLKDDISVMSVARNQDIFSVVKQDEDQEALWQAVQEAAEEALVIYDAMRSAEGEKLCQDLRARSEYIEQCVKEVEGYSAQAEEEYREKITTRMQELLGDSGIEEGRIIAEAAMFADKINITEELVRLRSHISQFLSMIQEDKPVGRKIDFLIQEMNREVNTIGSKSNQIGIARLVVDIKSEIEKIREQVQNLE